MDYQIGDSRTWHFSGHKGVALKDNQIFVADTYNSAVRIINLEEKEVSTLIRKERPGGTCRFDEPKCDPLGLYEPSNVEFYEDRLYICDANNHLIRVFDLKTDKLNTLEIRI